MGPHCLQKKATLRVEMSKIRCYRFLLYLKNRDQGTNTTWSRFVWLSEKLLDVCQQLQTVLRGIIKTLVQCSQMWQNVTEVTKWYNQEVAPYQDYKWNNRRKPSSKLNEEQHSVDKVKNGRKSKEIKCKMRFILLLWTRCKKKSSPDNREQTA
jgi:hypothetical protein